MDHPEKAHARGQKAGGIAALYLAFAYLAAIPYFLALVDYPAADTAERKVELILGHYPSLYAMYLASYVVFGIALGVLVFAVHDRLKAKSPAAARVTAAVGFLWAILLVASGMVFAYGMTAIVALAGRDPAQARLAWQAVEMVALALGGAGGELLGGLWVGLVSFLAARGGSMPKALGWLGMAIGLAGLVSIVPPLHDAAMVFGLLQIVWFVWIGLRLIERPRETDGQVRP